MRSGRDRACATHCYPLLWPGAQRDEVVSHPTRASRLVDDGEPSSPVGTPSGAGSRARQVVFAASECPAGAVRLGSDPRPPRLPFLPPESGRGSKVRSSPSVTPGHLGLSDCPKASRDLWDFNMCFDPHTHTHTCQKAPVLSFEDGLKVSPIPCCHFSKERYP